jgi:glycosyltransferase involved in cell wall biosynthesis
MKIGIDFHAAEQEGSGNCTYIKNLVESLLATDRENEYFLYITDPAFPYYRQFVDRRNVHLRPLGAKDALRRIPWLGLKTRLDRVDLLHVQYVAPPFYRRKLVVSVHDLSFVDNPDYFSWGKRTYLKILVPFSLKKAGQVITISDFSRRDIISAYHIPAERIHVTHLAAHPRFKPELNPEAKRSALKKLGLQDRFLLFVGRLDVRKNIMTLLRAFSYLKRTKRIPHQLVITGKKDFLPVPLLKEIYADDIVQHVVLTGFVPDELLPTLYSLAEVFVYPSLYEGFGLPVLEAMASGCPIIASNTTSFPEIVGEAGLLVNPRLWEGLAEAIWTVISDETLRADLRQKSLAQSQKFRWAETAQKTMNVYKKAIQEPF